MFSSLCVRVYVWHRRYRKALAEEAEIMKHVPGWKAGESVYKTKVTWIPPRCVHGSVGVLDVMGVVVVVVETPLTFCFSLSTHSHTRTPQRVGLPQGGVKRERGEARIRPEEPAPCPPVAAVDP